MPQQKPTRPANPTVVGRVFPATQWDLVARAGQAGETRDAALDELCRVYWYPVYAYLRRRGYGRPDAEDITQSFFVKLLADDTFVAADSERGRLRNFLLSALARHIADLARHNGAQKRGGSGVVISFDGMDAKERYAAEPKDNRDPETLFLHAWAHGLLDTVRARLREAFAVAGKADVFELLLPFLMNDTAPPSYREVASRLSCSEAAAGVHVLRLRRKFRELLHSELAATVSEPGGIEQELAWLRSMLGTK